MPQVSYGTSQPQWVNGQVADGSPVAIDSYTNELLAQISTVTWAGDAGAGGAGAHTLTIEGPDGEVVSVSHNAADGETSAQIATAIAALLNADADFVNMATLVDDTAGELTLTFLHEGRVYAINATTQAGTVAVVTTQAAGGTDLALGIAVAEGSADGLVAAVAAGTVDDDVVGLTVRSLDALVNELEGPVVSGAENVFGPGRTVSVMRQGACIALVEDAVTKGADVFVRIANAAAGDPLGMPRSDAAGGDAIELTGARFGSSTTGRGLAIITLNRP